jgi:hypothetical protein
VVYRLCSKDICLLRREIGVLLGTAHLLEKATAATLPVIVDLHRYHGSDRFTVPLYDVLVATNGNVL